MNWKNFNCSDYYKLLLFPIDSYLSHVISGFMLSTNYSTDSFQLISLCSVSLVIKRCLYVQLASILPTVVGIYL
jgi:hypothetical protein